VLSCHLFSFYLLALEIQVTILVISRRRSNAEGILLNQVVYLKDGVYKLFFRTVGFIVTRMNPFCPGKRFFKGRAKLPSMIAAKSDF